MSLSDIMLGQATEVPAGGLSVTGTITYDQDRVSRIGPKAQGRIVELPAQVGARVQEGEILAHLESPEVGAIRAESQEAEALVEIARENHARETRLEAQGITSRRELLEAEAELRRSEAKLQSTKERLRVLGADVHGDGGHFDILSPFAGVVVERAAGRGEVVAPEDVLFTVADLRALWIELDIYERDLHRAVLGQPVEITTEAWPDRTFEGQIVYVADILDTQRRTVRARVEVENRDGALKPGMFATATIQSGNGRLVIAVPRDAVQTLGGEEIVWVPGEEEGEFFAFPVLLGEELPGNRVAIASGFDLGTELVVQGAFTLKAELAKGAFGGHAH
jgi:cobalt-zinc-cadmium efflux system membrane fusion protein